MKLELSPSAYLSKAWPGPIPSSIPSAIAEYKKFAEDSKTAAQNAERASRRIAWVATIGVILATLGVVVPSLLASWQLMGGVKDSVAGLREQLNASNQRIQRLTDAMEGDSEGPLGDIDPAAMQTQLEDLHAAVLRLEAQLDALRAQGAQP